MKELPTPFNQLPNTAAKLRIIDETVCLFKQGDKPEFFYFIEQGEAVLTRLTESGDEVIIHTAFAGEMFAEASLFSENYHCDATVKRSSRLWEIDKEAVLLLSRESPEFSLELSACFAKQLQVLRGQRELLAIRSASERVYSAMSRKLLKSNIKQFSLSIGLTHEATYRALSELVKSGRILKLGRGEYVLPEKTFRK